MQVKFIIIIIVKRDNINKHIYDMQNNEKSFVCLLQQKLREEREFRRSRLSRLHDCLLQIVAFATGLDKGDVEDFIVEDPEAVCLLL